MDRITTNQQRLAYAKVCVEVDASMDLRHCIEVELCNGNYVTINVEIPWMLRNVHNAEYWAWR